MLLNEFIAEGNAMSLKRGASLDINQLIGEDTAGTVKSVQDKLLTLLNS